MFTQKDVQRADEKIRKKWGSKVARPKGTIFHFTTRQAVDKAWEDYRKRCHSGVTVSPRCATAGMALIWQSARRSLQQSPVRREDPERASPPGTGPGAGHVEPPHGTLHAL